MYLLVCVTSFSESVSLDFLMFHQLSGFVEPYKLTLNIYDPYVEELHLNKTYLFT